MPKKNRPDSRLLIIRSILVFTVLLSLGWWNLHSLSEALLPLFSAFLKLLDNRLLITDFSVGHIGGDKRPVPELVFRLEATVVRPIVIGHGVLAPKAGGWLASSTPAGAMLQPVILAYGLLLCWPAAQWRTLVLRMLLALVPLSLLLLLDIPLVLWAYIWEPALQHFGADAFSPLLMWGRFMMNGGRLLLAVLIAFGIIATLRPTMKKGLSAG